VRAPLLALALFGCVLGGACSGGPAPDAPSETDAGSSDGGASGDGALGADADAGGARRDAGSSPSDAQGGAEGGRVADAGTPECPAGAVFCESFEDGIDPARWSINGDAKTFSVDGTVARDGTGSLHMAYGKPYGHTGQPSLEIKTPIPAPDDRIYLRAYLRFGDLKLPGYHPAFINVIDSTDHEIGFGSIINDFALLGWIPGKLDNPRIWYEGGGGWHDGNEDGDDTPDTENGLSARSWICLEMMYFGDDQGPADTTHAAEEVKVWINGTEIPDLEASDALWRGELGHDPPEHWSPIYNNAKWRFGVEDFGPENVALDVWFDAIAFSHSRIGCLP
jgi:hypothetical protein